MRNIRLSHRQSEMSGARGAWYEEAYRWTYAEFPYLSGWYAQDRSRGSRLCAL